MQEKIEFQLSKNKRDYLSIYGNEKLSSEEIYRLSQHYKKKLGITIYVQTYLPKSFNEFDCKGDTTEWAFYNMVQIQEQLAEGEYVGYLHTNGATKKETSHIECFIISKTDIIKPIKWRVDSDVEVRVPSSKGHAETDLYSISKEVLIPQADALTCASISISYLKQHLKDEAKQLKELTLTIPYYNSWNRLCYFFVPSPQALVYSQSVAFNQCLQLMVTHEKSGFFLHKEKKIQFKTLKEILEETKISAKSPEIKQEAEKLLEFLPSFSKRWGEEFDLMHAKHTLMQTASQNNRLAYTSKRLKKIAIMDYEQTHNPGLTLLEEIKAKKNDASLSDEELLQTFIESFAALKFDNVEQLGYFLNKMSELVNCEIFYPLFFNFESHISLLSDVTNYKECAFLLNAKARNQLHTFIKEPAQFQKFINKELVYSVILFSDILKVPEKDRVNFLKERLSKEEFGPLLLNYLLSYNTSFFDKYFVDKSMSLNFFRSFIDNEMIIAMLPELLTKNRLINLNLLFENERDFHDFFLTNLPPKKAIELLKEKEYFSFNFNNYLSCLPKEERASYLYAELNDFSSPLMKDLIQKKQHPRCILELIQENFDEIQIENYLTINRDFFLTSMINTANIYPVNLRGNLQEIAKKINFFHINNPNILEGYQKAFGQCEDYNKERFLQEILAILPETDRWQFIEMVFAPQGKEFIENIALKNKIKPPMKDEQKIAIVVEEESTKESKHLKRIGSNNLFSLPPDSKKIPQKLSLSDKDDKDIPAKYYKTIFDYLQTQMLRLPEHSEKHVKLSNHLTDLSENKEMLVSELKDKLKLIREIVAKHRDTGIKGFFKATWARETASYKILTTLFDENNELKNPKP